MNAKWDSLARRGRDGPDVMGDEDKFTSTSDLIGEVGAHDVELMHTEDELQS